MSGVRAAIGAVGRTGGGGDPAVAAPPSTGTAGAGVLAGVLLVAGVAHLVRPGPFDGLIPRALGRPRPWVLGSGVAEIACGLAVAHPATRRRGGLATAALLLAVWPGNVTMAVRARHASARRRAVLWARLPLQLPLVTWARAVAHNAP